jgi:hypothetical protein
MMVTCSGLDAREAASGSSAQSAIAPGVIPPICLE